MKKMTMTEARSIVGGAFQTCVDTYTSALVNNQTACFAVKTCTDKNGVETKTYTPAALGDCGNAN